MPDEAALHPLKALRAPIAGDGAFGTWFAERYGDAQGRCERANLADPASVTALHREYLDAGARLLRTNTFAANRVSLAADDAAVSAVVAAGHAAARAACVDRPGVLVAASVGPVPVLDPDGPDASDEARAAVLCAAVDAHLDAGADLLFFETFSECRTLLAAARHARARNPGVFVVASFAVLQDGRTRRGQPFASILDEVSADPAVDWVGLNCASGPSHLLEVLETLPAGAVRAFLPNSGYPVRLDDRTVYGRNPDYFAETALRAADRGALLIGGCCGTTPEHVRQLAARLAGAPPARAAAPKPVRRIPPSPLVSKAPADPAAAASATNAPSPAPAPSPAAGRTVTVEIDPPFDADIATMLAGAHLLADAGVRSFSVADSPMGRARLDPVLLAARLQRETGVPTLPHLACRDRNLNALRSLLLGAHTEGIRRVLAVTGDPLPEGLSGEVKPVFDLSSRGLLALVAEMNGSEFAKAPMLPGAAVGVHAPNWKAEKARTERKIQAGARFLFTQPVYGGAAAENAADLARSFPGVAVHVGILPPVSLRNARFLHNEVPGIRLTSEALAAFSEGMSREEAEEAGLAVALAAARAAGPDVAGYFLMPPFHRYALIARFVALLRAAGLAG